MGFFKRLLSAGSKKNKKISSAKEEAQEMRRYHSLTLPVLLEADSEAAANRLLRTASSRLGAMRYSAGDEPLPPLPNREFASPLCCFVLLRRPPRKAHPEVEEEAKTRTLPFLPNRRYMPMITSTFAHGCSAHPLVSPAELNTLAPYSPRKQGMLAL
jgi:hypothetical protein